MRSYFRYWHEVFRLPSWSHSRIVDMVVTTNEPRCATCSPRGGAQSSPFRTWRNWDLAGAWACLTGLPVSTVAERLRPESLFNRFVAYRARARHRGRAAVRRRQAARPPCGRRWGVGRVVCLLADRSFGKGGVDVTLLGEPARLPGGPAALSRMSKVPVIVATPSYHGLLLRLEISDPIDPIAGRDGVRGDDPADRRRLQRGDPALRRRTGTCCSRVFVADRRSPTE